MGDVIRGVSCETVSCGTVCRVRLCHVELCDMWDCHVELCGMWDCVAYGTVWHMRLTPSAERGISKPQI